MRWKCKWNKIEKLNAPAEVNVRRISQQIRTNTGTGTYKHKFLMCSPCKHVQWFFNAFKSAMNFENMLTKLIGRFVCKICSRSCRLTPSHPPPCHFLSWFLPFWCSFTLISMRLIYDYCRTNIQIKYSSQMYVSVCMATCNLIRERAMMCFVLCLIHATFSCCNESKRKARTKTSLFRWNVRDANGFLVSAKNQMHETLLLLTVFIKFFLSSSPTFSFHIYLSLHLFFSVYLAMSL